MRCFTALACAAILLGIFTRATGEPTTRPAPARATGPLRVLEKNPRYFTDGSGKAILLTGSHTWNNLQDLGSQNPPPALDFNQHLDFLQKHGHNFIRLWRWELFEWKSWLGGKDEPLHHCALHPWKRTGPGKTLDGLPQFDLQQFDPAYFERLRSRVAAAGERGIYVSIMLFEGWCLRTRPSHWAGHPMNAANNVSGINGDPNADGMGIEVQTLKIPAVLEIQKAYVRKVIDTVNDLDNVLYEIANESAYQPAIQEWQEHMVRFINEYQARKPRQHPVGMTNLVASIKDKPASNAALVAGPAVWISPGAETWGPDDRYSFDPPAARGKKVEILDTDHTWNNACGSWSSKQRADHAWVWMSFLRGFNPIYMDPIDLAQPRGVLKYAQANTEAILSARAAMGHARAAAARMDLAAMTPHDELASSRYCLANPGREYLVYLPEGGEVTLDLSGAAGALTVEWIHPIDGRVVGAQPIAGGASRALRAPFVGPAAAHLRSRE